MKLGGQLAGIEDARSLAQAIVDTVREPLLVLDRDLRVVTASRSFYLTFRVNRQEFFAGRRSVGHPGPSGSLGKDRPEHAVLNDYEVEHQFPHIGALVLIHRG